MNGGDNSRGYTIVEVLIFMAVSGLMFVLAVVFVSGKQASTEFRQGLYVVNSEIRTVINDVANGRSQPLRIGGTNVRCTAPAGGQPIFSTGNNAQGANGGTNGCIFLGKVLQFNVADRAPENRKFYNVFTVAGRQMKADGTAVTTFASALPVPIAPPYSPARNLTETSGLLGGLEVQRMLLCYTPNCSSNLSIGAVGIFGSFNPALGTAAGAAQSGAQTVITAVIPGSSFGASTGATASAIGTQTRNINNSHIIGSGQYVLLCFRSGDKVGSVSIGGISGQQFTTEVKIGGVAGVCS